MRKMMFLAFALSLMAIGTASANEVERRPGGVVFGIGGESGFVMINVGGPHGRDKGCCDHDYRHGGKRPHDRHHHRDDRCGKGRKEHRHHGHHDNKPPRRPGCDKGPRPGTPPPHGGRHMGR